MLSIVMDSANQYLVVALYKDDTCLEKIQELGNRKQSEYAIVYLEKLLKNQNITMNQIDEMIITIGPGSYTGVRVALTIAKTLNATMNIKIKTISSLKAFAGYKDAISILDARSKKVFLGVYSQGKTIVEDCLVEVENIQSYIDKYPEFELVGDVHLINKEKEDIDLANTIYHLSKDEKYVEEVDALVPVYIKEVEAKKICA